MFIAVIEPFGNTVTFTEQLTELFRVYSVRLLYCPQDTLQPVWREKHKYFFGILPQVVRDEFDQSGNCLELLAIFTQPLMELL